MKNIKKIGLTAIIFVIGFVMFGCQNEVSQILYNDQDTAWVETDNDATVLAYSLVEQVNEIDIEEEYNADYEIFLVLKEELIVSKSTLQGLRVEMQAKSEALKILKTEFVENGFKFTETERGQVGQIIRRLKVLRLATMTNFKSLSPLRQEIKAAYEIQDYALLNIKLDIVASALTLSIYQADLALTMLQELEDIINNHQE